MTVSLIASAAIGVVVQGTSTCPSAEDVERELARLLPDSATAATEARLEPTEGGVRVSLRSAERGLIAERTFDRAQCSDLAQAAAVTIATWLEELGGEPLAPIELPREPPLPERRPREPRDPREGAQVTEVLLGGALLATQGHLRPGVRASAKLIAGYAGLGGSFYYDLPREYSAASGFVSWQAPMLGVHGVWRVLRVAPLTLDLQGGLSAAWFRVEGRELDQNLSDAAVELGPYAALELELGRSTPRPYLELGAVYWLREASARVEPLVTVPLPRWQAFSSLGLAFSL